MNYNEVDSYHPRYARTEYLTYEEDERRRRRRGVVGLLVALVCTAALLYVVSQ